MTLTPETSTPRVVIVGGGPAGLMAAETLTQGHRRIHVQLFDAMPSVGRKFLLAGKGGLNLTHAEELEKFLHRYGDARETLSPAVSALPPAALRDWASDLGVETFVGSTGRVFPTDMKAAPLLRAWLQRLRSAGVQFSMRHRWTGWTEDGSLRFDTPHGETVVAADTFDAVVLALGGGSWARLGSDGAWVSLLAARGVAVAPLRPSNCGFDVGRPPDRATPVLLETRRDFLKELVGQPPAPEAGWTSHFAGRFAGEPFKSVALSFTDSQGRHFNRKGEFVATATGVEGSLIYAVSSLLRDEIAAKGHATFTLDLLPHQSLEQVLVEIRHPRGSRSLSSHLKSRLSLDGIKASVLHELLSKESINDPVQLAHAIKALPVTVVRPRPIDEAISTAGGVRWLGVDAHLHITVTGLEKPVFCAGEMLDWEAPTGGYLLTACFATGRTAAQGVLHHLAVS